MASLTSTAFQLSRWLCGRSVSSSSRLPAASVSTVRGFSGNGGGDKSKNRLTSFRPRRRPSKTYRPIRPGVTKEKEWFPGNEHKIVELGNVDMDDYDEPADELDLEFGPLAASVIRDRRKEMDLVDVDPEDPVERDLRMMDYMTSMDGSTEDLVAMRRGLAREFDSPEDQQQYEDDLEEIVRKGRIWNMGLNEDEDDDDVDFDESKDPFSLDDEEDEDVSGERDPDTTLDPNQLAHGEWAEMLVTTDRTTKLWRGGRLETYRTLVIGGNMNGCGGFGIGKNKDPIVSLEIASRKCKRNIFFVDRYQGNGLTRDLVGKQNSCKVIIRATDNGLRGNELCREILKRFGITNAVAKSHGNRNVYNVVRATFKALMTHESIEDIALKRGKRIVSIERAIRMQI